MRGSKMTHEEFVSKVNSLTNEYIVSSEYKGINKKVFFRHITCGKFFEMRPQKFLNEGHRCPYCSIRARKNFYDVLERIKEKNPNYILKEYSTMNGDAKIYCAACKSEFVAAPTSILIGSAVCPVCKQIKKESKRTLSSESFLKRIKLKFRGQLFPLGNYKTEKTKMKFYCSNCQNTFYSSGRELLEKDFSCPYCRTEQEIANLESVLLFSDIHYVKDKFVDLKISFNFYLPDYNIYIDYLGTQFYDKIHTGLDIVSYNSKLHRDRKRFVRENRLKALCIPYYDAANFSKYIKSLLSTFNKNIPITYNQFIVWKKSLGLRSYKNFQNN